MALSLQTPTQLMPTRLMSIAGVSPDTPFADWGTALLPLIAELDRYVRRAAREEYSSLLAEQKRASELADQNDQIVTVSQAAGILGVIPQTVYDWIKAGKLNAVRMGSRTLRLKQGEVLASLRSQTQPDGRRKYARRTNGTLSRKNAKGGAASC